MKTPEQVKKEIEELILQKKDAKTYRALKKINNKIEDLKTIVLYLETNPSEEFIKSEKARLEKQVDAIEDNFQKWLNSGSSRRHSEKPLKVYYKEMKLEEVTKRLKTINYLLE